MDVELLILKVKENSAIYDASDRNHSNRYLISSVWRKIGEELNIPGKVDIKTEKQDSDEQDLAKLKSVGQLGRTLDLIKSQAAVYTNINEEKQLHSESKEEVKLDGETISKVDQLADTNFNKEVPETKIQTEIDIPSKGLHHKIVQFPSRSENAIGQLVSRRSAESKNLPPENDSSMSKLDVVDGIHYSPLDVAEYVFWTGDERGVTLAIQEFLQEGLISREEAINFLEEIKYNLDNLKNHYTQIGFNSLQRIKSKELSRKNSEFDQKHSILMKPELQNDFRIKQFQHETDKRHSLESPIERSNSEENSEDDYDQLLERLRMADFLYTEYSLEEVIYQLAKLMFTQSLTHGSAEAQQALQKFTNFLEAEASQGHISRALEKKVLDVLIASLTDTLSEHPELLLAAKSNMGSTPTNAESENFIRQILNSNLESKHSPRDSFSYYKEETKNFASPKPLSKNPFGHLAFDFFKYKNS